MELFDLNPLLNSQHSRFENLNYVPLNHWTVATHSNQLDCYQISNPQSGCNVSFAIYHNSCHICTWIDKIYQNFEGTAHCNEKSASRLFQIAQIALASNTSASFLTKFWQMSTVLFMGRPSPRGLNNEPHWNFRPKELKPNHTIYSYKMFTYIAKKSSRGGYPSSV